MMPDLKALLRDRPRRLPLRVIAATMPLRSGQCASKKGSSMTYVIALPCVDLLDKTCIDECPVDCIYEGDRMLYIHPDECVDCGACEPVCPVEAISFEADVAPQWKGFYRVNVEFFTDLGSPGGASRVGRIGRDHPVVAALPIQR